MKRLAFALAVMLSTATSAVADNDVELYGRIVEKGEASVAIGAYDKKIDVMVSPFTKIEVEVRGLLHYDYNTTFDEVKVGDWAKIEAVPNGYGEFYAKEIEVVR